MTAPHDSTLATFDDLQGNAADLLPMAPAPSAPETPPALELHWLNRFESLGTEFFARLSATPLPEPHWVARSESAAADLGLPADWWQRDGGSALQVLSGNAVWPGSHPLASVYSGHQFGQWAGQLGDGRAIWLGEIDTPNGPTELQLKGAGATPYSRMGDGRAVLRSSIREFLCSEAMHGLGIPTTRALCITGSPRPVRREEIETAAVVTRSAPSFIRFGHFEHFVHTAPDEGFTRLHRLADFVIDHHYPECRDADNPYAAFLEAVSRRTAMLMAQWQAVGFCHGVMNTDNMSILGLTIDYGPFGFLDGFNPNFICNHTDSQGRYAYSQQPNVGFWNLHALAQAMVPLIGDSDRTLAALEPYKAAFAQATMASMRAKLGLSTPEPEDHSLIEDFMKVMAKGASDFSISFRRLSLFDATPGADNAKVRDDYLDLAGFDAWAPRYAERLRREKSIDAERALRMNAVNPKFVLRNHLAEVAIRQAKAGDFSEVERLLRILSKPFDEQPDHEAYADHPPEWAQQIEVSCSS